MVQVEQARCHGSNPSLLQFSIYAVVVVVVVDVVAGEGTEDDDLDLVEVSEVSAADDRSTARWHSNRTDNNLDVDISLLVGWRVFVVAIA